MAITATIDWCEPNYAVVPYIAEFWNTLSSVVMVLLGACGITFAAWVKCPKFCATQFAFLALVGVGSTLFHATLDIYAQMLDEIPMMWHTLAIIEFNRSLLRGTYRDAILPSWPFIAWGALLSVIHAKFQFVLVFQVHFIVITLYSIVQMAQLAARHPMYAHMARMQLLVASMGAIAWLMDHHRIHCDTLYLHAWWHVLVGFATFAGLCMTTDIALRLKFTHEGPRAINPRGYYMVSEIDIRPSIE